MCLANFPITSDSGVAEGLSKSFEMTFTHQIDIKQERPLPSTKSELRQFSSFLDLYELLIFPFYQGLPDFNLLGVGFFLFFKTQKTKSTHLFVIKFTKVSSKPIYIYKISIITHLIFIGFRVYMSLTVRKNYIVQCQNIGL